jgi:hypothetical protein
MVTATSKLGGEFCFSKSTTTAQEFMAAVKIMFQNGGSWQVQVKIFQNMTSTKLIPAAGPGCRKSW